MLAVDLANYTDVPTPVQLAQLKALGVTRAVIGCSYPRQYPDGPKYIGATQLAAFYAAGFEVEAYAWVTFAAGWEALVDQTLTAIARLPAVRRVWLDCEEDPGTATPAQVEARIAACAARVMLARPDLVVGIYTGTWWWDASTGSSARFKTFPLWCAGYGPVLTLPRAWKSAVMWQYADHLDGTDYNVDVSRILEGPMTSDEQAAFDALARAHADLQQQVTALANGTDAVLKGALRYVWALAAKAWPWPAP
ncbi:MAG: hypothetical protein KGK07_15675 [Chloroflexota bacterium]|nr:hypothetical protein [Chloroflexota bacterium]